MSEFAPTMAARPEPPLIESLRQAAHLHPTDAAIHRQLGNALLAAGLAAEAIDRFRLAIDIDPESVRAYNNLGLAHMRLGQVREAMGAYQRALALDPRYAIAHSNLGMALHQLGEVEAAIASYRRAIALNPKLIEAHCNCGNALWCIDRSEEAIVLFDEALALRPDSVPALLGRGNAWQQLRRFDRALRDYQRVLQLAPDHAEAHNHSANALLAMKRLQEALSSAEAALRLSPGFPEAHHSRASALHELHRYPEALAALEHALALRPDYIEALCSRGKLLRKMGEHQAAEHSFERAVELKPVHAEARLGRLMCILPAMAAQAAEIDASRARFDAALTGFAEWLRGQPEIDEAAVVGSLQPFFLAYQEFDNRTLLTRYGSLCTQLMSRWRDRTDRAPPSATATAGRRPDVVRVGILSAQLRDHSVYRALVRGWLQQLDRAKVEVGVFDVGSARDQETDAAARHGAFYVGGDRTLQEWVEVIRSTQLDALIYPEIGMDATTLRLASMRLAPCQIAAWGHPETTGLATIDYYLSAELFERPGSDSYYSEQLVRLPHLGCYYEPYDEANVAVDLTDLGIARDAPLLLCPGTPFKYAPQHDRVLVEIARRLGRCQLVVFQPAEAGLGQKLRARLVAAFRAQKLDAADHLRFVPWLSRNRFFGLMRQADVYLDTIGFSGFNSAMQAVECDLPAVTYEGRFMRGRLASAIMQQAGLTELIARSADEYVELAIALVRDTGFNERMRARLRASKSALFRDRASIAGLEEFLIRTVRAAREPAH